MSETLKPIQTWPPRVGVKPEVRGVFRYEGATQAEIVERCEALALATAQPERAPLSDVVCDRAYRNGLMAGFAFGQTGNEEGYRKSLGSYQREIAAHGIKQETAKPSQDVMHIPV